MAMKIRRVSYFYATVQDQPGEGYKILSRLAEFGVNLLGFSGVPMGPKHTHLTIFPEDDPQLQKAARDIGLKLDGPHPALLVQGDDELGALAGIHEKLNSANINVYASSGVTDGRGSFAYVLYVRPDKYERAVEALEV